MRSSESSRSPREPSSAFRLSEGSGPERYEAWFATPFGRRTDRVERALLKRLLAGIPHIDSVLEVGCGSGHFLDAWPGRYLFGLDRDKEMLEFVYNRLPSAGLVLGDARALPFRDRSIDVVTLVTMLEFVAEPAIALQEAGRVARHGLVVMALNKASPVAWYRRLRRARAYRDAHFYCARELQVLVRRSLRDRPIDLHIEGALYPHPWLDRFHTFPGAALIGLRVVFT